MIAILTLLILFALGAALDDAVSAARRAIVCRRARRACMWRPRRPDSRFSLVRAVRR